MLTYTRNAKKLESQNPALTGSPPEGVIKNEICFSSILPSLSIKPENPPISGDPITIHARIIVPKRAMKY